MRTISSRHNPLVRAFRELADDPSPSGERVLLDGVHLVNDASHAAATFEVVAVAASRLESDTEEGRVARALERAGVDVVVAGAKVFEAMSPVRTPSGIVAIASRRSFSAADACETREGFVVAAADVQDPGNVGSLIRAADAGGATAAMICGTSANPFSWKALRGSMGSTLRLPVVSRLTTIEAVDCMRGAGVHVVAAVARGGDDPDDIQWKGKVGLLVGGEGAGLSDDVAARCDARVTIPMTAGVESLNVAVAAGILIYAARRQRV